MNGCVAAVGRINSTALWANSGGQTFVCVCVYNVHSFMCVFMYMRVHVCLKVHMRGCARGSQRSPLSIFYLPYLLLFVVCLETGSLAEPGT